MNDWPADPELDASLRRLVDSELEGARADGLRSAAPRMASVTKGPVRAHSRSRLAGIAILGTALIVAAVALRGTIKSPGAGADASGEPGPSATAEGESPSPQASVESPALTPTVAPTLAPTLSPRPSGAGRWVRVGGATSSAVRLEVPLADGRVLLIDNPGAEIFDPATGKFTRTGNPTAVHPEGSATLLADGRVLFAGGVDDSANPGIYAKNISNAEIYDPSSGNFSATGPMVEARFGQTATLLVDGRVLIAGGGIEHVTGLGDRRPGTTRPSRVPGTATMSMIDSAELYDPKTGTFKATGSMTVGRDFAAAARLADGRVLIAGGGDEGNMADASADLYDPKTGKFSPTGLMLTGRYSATATLLAGGRVLISGGTNGSGFDTSLELYDPATGRFADGGSSDNRGFVSVVPLGDGRALFVGGADDTTVSKTNGPVPLYTCDTYDPSTHKLSRAASMNADGAISAVALPDGRVLAFGDKTGQMYVP